MTAPEMICCCCELPQPELFKAFCCSEPICKYCIFTWYEGATVDAIVISGRSRLAQGYVMRTYEP